MCEATVRNVRWSLRSNGSKSTDNAKERNHWPANPAWKWPRLKVMLLRTAKHLNAGLSLTGYISMKHSHQVLTNPCLEEQRRVSMKEEWRSIHSPDGVKLPSSEKTREMRSGLQPPSRKVEANGFCAPGVIYVGIIFGNLFLCYGWG